MCPWGKCPGGKCPGFFCPVTILSTNGLCEVVDHTRSKMYETCLIIILIYDLGVRSDLELKWGPLN